MSANEAGSKGPKPYASFPAHSRGRLYGERESASRDRFERDRDRVIHSGAFRRLKHKTQVFVYHEGDYYRTRLTHSIEVAQIARSLTRRLGLNEDLAETLALAHDLGHTCFGHAGESALDAAMREFGGFDHNEQTFRIVTSLERRYAEFDGLNLTWETLEGLVKHNGPVLAREDAEEGGDHSQVPATFLSFQKEMDLQLSTFASLEAQVASLSDDIAYTNHDIDDGLRAGLFALEELAELPILDDILRNLKERYPDLEQPRVIHETIRRLIGIMTDSLVSESGRRIDEAQLASADDARQAARAVIAFDEATAEDIKRIRAFLFERMYRHHSVLAIRDLAKEVVRNLFGQYFACPESLSDEWRDKATALEGRARARLVGDYIAGMTDRYALREYEKFFNIKVFEE